MSADAMASRLEELAKRALYTGEVTFTRFLDMAAQSDARRAAGSVGVPMASFGGYPDAERRVVAFGAEDSAEDLAWPLVPVRISWRAQFGSPGHRDILGALMGLAFEREMIGDIVLAEDWACLFAEESMADYITANLTSCGRITVRCERMTGLPDLPPPKGRAVRETVPSLRLDAVLAAGMSLSRSEASRYIQSGRVFVDQSQTLKADAPLREGQLVSVRGMGRFRLERTDGE